jgi:hypothetical protein
LLISLNFLEITRGLICLKPLVYISYEQELRIGCEQELKIGCEQKLRIGYKQELRIGFKKLTLKLKLR